MDRITRCLGIVIISTCSMQCDQMTPTKPTAVETDRVSAPPRDPFGPVTGGVAQAQRDTFAGCLAGDRTPACFSGGSAETPVPTRTWSAFGQCLNGNGGETCFTGASVSRGTVHATALAAAPTNLTGSVSNETVMFTWSQPPGETVLSYQIEAGSAPGLANLASISTGTTATSYAVSGVPAGQYYVRVRAVNASGASGTSNEIVVIVGANGCTAPEKPILRLVSSSGGLVSLAWSVSVFNIRSYILQAGSVPGSADLANFDLGNAGLQFSTTGVPPGTYYVRVIGRNSCGLGPASNELVINMASSGGGAGLFVELNDCLRLSAPAEVTPLPSIHSCYPPPGTVRSVRVDGATVGSLTDRCAGQWLFDISPGRHTVAWCATEPGQATECDSPVTITVAPGQTYQQSFFVPGNFC